MSLPASDPAGAFDVVLPDSPYPGLRPFEKSEWPIFFGRERMVDEAIARLVRQHLVVVHGDSGCGKSSLIRAGVLARLEQDHARGGLAWRTCAAEPGEAPLQRLAESLAALDERPGDDARIVEIRRVLNFGPDAPGALLQMLRRGDTDHICILLDQFEELFAFAKHHGAAEARLLVQFLVGTLRQPPPGLFVVVTMRSEFLGACAQFPGLAEAVNDAQYLLPRMANLDLMRAIREPAALYGGHVAANLAQRLISDAGGTQDELPLIQHGLMALHRRKVASAATDEGGDPRGGTGAWRLELADYTAGLGLAPMLSAHADAVAAEAEPPPHILVEKLFRALTEINADGQAVRRPQTLERLAAVTGSDQATLENVIKPFRTEGASFLRPYGQGRLPGDTRIDISHEALIRSWLRIADKKDGWLAREFQDGLIWKSLLVQTESFERDRSNVLSPSTARERELWLQTRNAAWAERYGGRWAAVTDLVGTSVDVARKAEAAEKARFTRQVTLAGVAALLILGIMAWYNRQTSQALSRVTAAIASSLWDRLDFSDDEATTDAELNALWEVAAGNTQVKEAFRQQLTQSVHRGVTMGRRPEPMLRSIAMRWPSDQASASFIFIVNAIGAADPGDLRYLALAARSIGEQLTAEDAQRVFPTVRDLMGAAGRPATTAAYGRAAIGVIPRWTREQAEAFFPLLMTAIDATIDEDVLESLGEAAEVVARTFTPERAQAAFPDVLAAYAKTGDSDQMAALGATLRGLASRISGEQTEATLSLALATAGGTKRTPQDSGFIEMLQSLTGRVTAEQAGAALVPLVGRIVGTPRSRLEPLEVAARGLAARLGPEQAAALLPVLKGPLSTADGTVVSALRPVAKSVAASMPATHAQAAFPEILAAMTGATGPETIGVLADVMLELADEITPDQAQTAFTRVMTKFTRADAEDDEVEDLAKLLEKLATRFAAEQASSTFVRVRRQLARETDSTKLVAYSNIAQPLVQSVPPEQVRTAFPQVVAAFLNTTSVEPLAKLDALAAALATRLSPGQAAAFVPSVQAGVTRSEDADQLDALASALRALLRRMTADSNRIAYESMAMVSATLKSRDQAAALAGVVGETVAALRADQIQPAFALVLGGIEGTRQAQQLDRLVEAAGGLAGRLTPAHAGSLFDRVVSSMKTTTDEDQLAALGQVARILSASISAEYARRSFQDVIKATNESTANVDRQGSLAHALAGLAAHVEPEQKRQALHAIMAAIEQTTYAADVERLALLGSSVSATLTPEQAKDEVVFVQTVQSRVTDRDQVAAAGRISLALAERMPVDQTGGIVSRAVRAAGTTLDTDENNAAKLSAAFENATRRWPADRIEQLILSLIAWSATSEHAVFWARTLVARASRTPAESSVRTIVEALKFPTTGGAATAELLKGLRAVSPSAPGEQMDLAANLAWVARSHPAIDLDSPPVCPAPPAHDLLCPAANR
jgi:hypothetical protein